MLINKRIIQSPKSGFTIIEMLIIAPIVILMIGAFVSVIVSMTGEVLATRSSNVLAYDIKDALNRIEADIKLSTTFLATNTVTPLTTPQGYDNATSAFTNVDSGAKGDMLILNTLATTANPLNAGAGLVYLTGQPNTCASAYLKQNKPLTMNVIYFVKDSTLWRRSIMPSNYASTPSVVCALPWQIPSCAPTASGAFCKTKDIKLIEGINASDFNLQYFDTPNAASANATASNSAATLASRKDAIEPATTVNVTINVTKTAAGRDISQDGSIKATKLDTNASAIAEVVAPPVPAAPIVSAVISEPTTAIFTWPQVNAATTYTVNCSINGGAYTTCASNLTTPTFSSNSADRNQSVCVTVYAINSSGTSPSGAECITVPAWNTLFMQNRWSDYNNGYSTAAYTKTSSDVVFLKGLIKRSGAAVAGETLGTLPVGYRPAAALIFQTTTSPNIASRVDVYPDGTIRVLGADAGWLALDGIKFVPNGSPYPFTAPVLSNGWVNFGSIYQPAGYTIDGSGRSHVQGLVRSGNAANGTLIATLPTAMLSSQYLHIPAANNGFGQIGIEYRAANTPGVVAKTSGNNAWLSLNSMFYPSSFAGWTNLPLQNGWTWYGTIFSSPQYTKAADGIVTLKGLIGGGNAANGVVVANLPAGYRPKHHTIISLTGADVASRLDIWPDGNITVGTTSSAWTSLDGFHFIAEQ